MLRAAQYWSPLAALHTHMGKKAPTQAWAPCLFTGAMAPRLGSRRPGFLSRLSHLLAALCLGASYLTSLCISF